MEDQNNGTPKHFCVPLPEVPENNLTKNDSNEDSILHKKHIPIRDKHISDICENINHDPKNEMQKNSLLPSPNVKKSKENQSVEKHRTQEKASQKIPLSNQITFTSDMSIDDPKTVDDNPKNKTPKRTSASLRTRIDYNEERTSRNKQLLVQDKQFSDTSSNVCNKVNVNVIGETTKCSSTPPLYKLPNSSESSSARKDNKKERTLRKKELALQNKQVPKATTVVSKKIDSDSELEAKKYIFPFPKMLDSSESKSTKKDSIKEKTSRRKLFPIQDISIFDVSTPAFEKVSDALEDRTSNGSTLPLNKIPDSSENKSQGKDKKETRSSRTKQMPVHDMHICKVETSKHSSSTPLSKILDSSENKLTGKDNNDERSSRKKLSSVQDTHVVEASTAVSKKGDGDFKGENPRYCSAISLSMLSDHSGNKSALKGSNDERSRRKLFSVKDKHIYDASALASKNMEHSLQDEIPECSRSLPKSPDFSDNQSGVTDSNEVGTSQKKLLPIVKDRHLSNVLTTGSNNRNYHLKVVETAENKPAGKDITKEKKSRKKHISGIGDKNIFNENITTLNVTMSRKRRSCYSKHDEILKGDVTNLGESMTKRSLGILKIEPVSEGQKDWNIFKERSMSESDLHLQLPEAVTEVTAVKKNKKSLRNPNKKEGKNSEQIQKSNNRTSVTKGNEKFEVTKSNNKTLGSIENLSQDNDSLDIIQSSQESISTFLLRRPKIHECSVSLIKIDPILQAGTKIFVSQGNQTFTVLVPEYPYSPFKIYSSEKIESLKETLANRAETLSVSHSPTNELEALEENVHKEVKSKSAKESGKEILEKSEDLVLMQKSSPEDVMNETDKNVIQDVVKMKTKGGNNQKSEVKSYIPKPKFKQHNNLETVEYNIPQLEDEDQSIKLLVSKIIMFTNYSKCCNTRMKLTSSIESKHNGTSETEMTISPSPTRSLLGSQSSLLEGFSSPSGNLDLGNICHQRRIEGHAQYLVGLGVAAKEMNQEESLVASPVSSHRPEELRNILGATPLPRKKLLCNVLEDDVDHLETPIFERLQSSDVAAGTPLQHSPAPEPRTPDVPLKRALKLSSSRVDTPASKKKKVSISAPEVSASRLCNDRTLLASSSCPKIQKYRLLFSMKRKYKKWRNKKLLSTRSRIPPKDDNSMVIDISAQSQDSPDLTGLSSQGSVDMLGDSLNSKDVFFPPLISCIHPIESIAHHLTTHVMWTKALILELNHKGIHTVADLSRLDETSISRLPVAAPKIARTKEVLENYYKIIEPSSDKDDSKQDDRSGASSLSSQLSESSSMTTSDVVKYITSNKESLTAILGEVSRLIPCKKLNQEICEFLSKRWGIASDVSGGSSSEQNSGEGMGQFLEQVFYSDSENAKHTQGIFIRLLLSSGVNNVIKNLPQLEVARHIVKHYPDKFTEALSENPDFGKELLQDFFNSQLMSGELPLTEVFDKLAEGDTDNLLLNAMKSYLMLKMSPEEILQLVPMESLIQYAGARLSIVDLIGLCVQGLLSDTNQEIPLSHYQRLLNAVANTVSSLDFVTIHYEVMKDLLNKK